MGNVRCIFTTSKPHNFVQRSKRFYKTWGNKRYLQTLQSHSTIFQNWKFQVPSEIWKIGTVKRYACKENTGICDLMCISAVVPIEKAGKWAVNILKHLLIWIYYRALIGSTHAPKSGRNEVTSIETWSVSVYCMIMLVPIDAFTTLISLRKKKSSKIHLHWKKRELVDHVV